MSTSETEKQSLETDASLINGDALRELFEPNEEIQIGDAPTRQCCTYDRIGDPNLAFFLIAERGVGKTHVVRLLRDRLLARGDIVLPIEVPENPVRKTYEKLARQFPEQGATIWKLAILEEVAVSLVNTYLAPINSLVDRLAPAMLRRHLSTNGEMFSYLQRYRPEEWNRICNLLEKSGGSLAQVLVRLIERIRITINLQPMPSPTPLRLEVGANGVGERFPEFQPEPNDRVSILQKWIKLTLWTMQSIQRPLPSGEQEKRLASPLPNCASVYVIADQLDQWEQPLHWDQLRDLMVAAYQLRDMEINNRPRLW